MIREILFEKSPYYLLVAPENLSPFDTFQPVESIWRCGIRVSEVQHMNAEQERQVQEKPIEESMQQIEQDLRFLNWRVSKLGKMIRTALKQAKIVNLSAP